MRWDKELEYKLREYPRKKAALPNMREKIKYLDKSIYMLKGSFRDTDPVQSGGCYQEDILLDKIVEKEELVKNIEDVEWDIKWVDKALNCLDDLELKVITRMYLDDVKISVKKLCEELHYEKSQLYRIKDKAIYKMTLELYGKLYS